MDVAATDVQNAVQRALGSLPEDAERPVIRKAGANNAPIVFMNVIGRDYSGVELTDIADRLVKTPLQLLPGVAQAVIAGERRYAMRIWLDPARMAARRVDALDVKRALQESNLQLAAGQLEAQTRKFVVNAERAARRPEAVRGDRDPRGGRGSGADPRRGLGRARRRRLPGHHPLQRRGRGGRRRDPPVALERARGVERRPRGRSTACVRRCPPGVRSPRVWTSRSSCASRSTRCTSRSGSRSPRWCW